MTTPNTALIDEEINEKIFGSMVSRNVVRSPTEKYSFTSSVELM